VLINSVDLFSVFVNFTSPFSASSSMMRMPSAPNSLQKVSYLTRFHLVVQVSYRMCASALLKRTSSCWDTRKLNQVIMGNTRKPNQVKLKINHRRHLMHVATKPKLKTRFSAKLKNESRKANSNGMAALTSFSTAGVKSHAWVFDATHWRLTTARGRPLWLVNWRVEKKLNKQRVGDEVGRADVKCCLQFHVLLPPQPNPLLKWHRWDINTLSVCGMRWRTTMKNEFEFSSSLWQIKTTNHRLEKHRFGKLVVPKFFFEQTSEMTMQK
jgi:hypothetical protein